MGFNLAFKGLKLFKKTPGTRRLNNLNDPSRSQCVNNMQVSFERISQHSMLHCNVCSELGGRHFEKLFGINCKQHLSNPYTKSTTDMNYMNKKPKM